MRRILERLLNSIKKRLGLVDNDDNKEEVSDFPEGMVWVHPDISNWAVTATLNEVSVRGNTINLPYTHSQKWPGQTIDGLNLNANPWVIAEIDGKWYAATWEWMRFGQQSKAASAVEGGHIKRHPFIGWNPTSGEKLGFFVSGLIRGPQRNVSERTNVVWINWP